MKSFKYTHGGGVLTEEQRQFYEDGGYILIKNNVDHDLLDELSTVFRQRFVDVCERRVNRGFINVVEDSFLKQKGAKGEYLIHRIEDFLHDETFFKYATNNQIINVVASIIGPNITAAHSLLISKPPGSKPEASSHLMHQDLHYFPFRPTDRIVASWTAMEKINQINGGLYVVPGTHKDGLYSHSYPEGYKRKFFHGVNDLNHLTKLPIIMEKGDTIFFHPLLLHGSGPNLSDGFRKAIACHFVDNNCYFIDLKNTSQGKVVTEFEEAIKKRGVKVKYEDYWRLKSRLVAGAPGRFQNIESHL